MYCLKRESFDKIFVHYFIICLEIFCIMIFLANSIICFFLLISTNWNTRYFINEFNHYTKMQKLNTLVGTFYILNLKLYSIPISIYNLMHVYIFLSFLYLKLVKKKTLLNNWSNKYCKYNIMYGSFNYYLSKVWMFCVKFDDLDLSFDLMWFG